MKRYAFLLLVVLAALLVSGCSRDNTTAPTQSAATDQPQNVIVNPEAVAAELVARAGWVVESEDATDTKGGGPTATGGGGYIISSDREVIVGDIVHYYFEVQVGPGPHDLIGLHRVVRETRPGKPIRAKKNVFLQHGAGVGFVKFIFGSATPSTPDDHSVAVYLAQNGVDVWGIDQNWVLVPAETADFTFMSTWGMQNQIDNLGIGLGVARNARLMTGNGLTKMHLLGYSDGAPIVFAYADMETQLPPGLRQVMGLIPVEGGMKWGPEFENSRLSSCASAVERGDAYAQGIYEDPLGALFYLLGFLAETDPDGPSPLIEGLTNMQAALVFAAQTYVLGIPIPWYHFFAGEFDEYGFPVGLTYTTVPGFLEFVQTASPYYPVLFEFDIETILCDEADVPWDDHMAEITVPVLNIGAAGGLGDAGFGTLDLIGSTDQTVLKVQLLPDEDAALDFGHIDLWTAGDAPGLVWQPLLEWINDHSPKGWDTATRKKN